MILTCGDALVDFVTESVEGRCVFVPYPGGSVLNLATALGRLDVDVAFSGGVSRDMFGEMIVNHLAASNVDTRYVDRLDAGTTLAFAKLTGGASAYAFFDEGSAMRRWQFRPERFADIAPEAVHVGSIALIDRHAFGQARALVDAFSDHAVISLDPNCRPTLIDDPAAYRERIRDLMTLADIIKLSDEDLAYLAPETSVAAFMRERFALGTRLIILTKGECGVEIYTPEAAVAIEAEPCIVRDTIGAGDSFQGAFLAALERQGVLQKDAVGTLGEDRLVRIGRFAATAAAITCGRDGANPPWLHEIGREG